MIVSGFSYVGTLARPAQVALASQAVPTRSVEHTGAASDAPTSEPTYFRAISAISPGSLAALYQSMKAHEASSGSKARDIEPAAPDASVAILSGVGVPAAMSAYGEVLETADDR